MGEFKMRLPKPNSRIEKYQKYLGDGVQFSKLPKPDSRPEKYLYAQCVEKNLKSGLLKDKGTLLVGAFNAADWVLNGCTVTDNPNTPEGVGSCIELTQAQQYANISKAVDFDISDMNVLGFWIWIENPLSLASFVMRLSGSTTASDISNCYATPALFPSDKLSEGWNYIKMLKNKLTKVGTPLDRIRTVVLETSWVTNYYDYNWNVTTTPVTHLKFRFGGLWKNPRGTGAKVLLTFDSAGAEFKTVADMMIAKNMRGSIYNKVIDFVNKTTVLSKSILDDLYYNKDWDICNDTWSRLGVFATLTNQQITEELQKGIDGMLEVGYSRGALHGASPTNQTDNTSLAIIKSLGFKTFRGGKGRPFNQFVVSNKETGLLNYPIRQIGSTTTQQNIVDWLNEAMMLETPICIFGHGAMTTPTSYYATPAIWQFLINQIAARGLETPTISEFYDSI